MFEQAVSVHAWLGGWVVLAIAHQGSRNPVRASVEPWCPVCSQRLSNQFTTTMSCRFRYRHWHLAELVNFRNQQQ